MSTCVQDAQSKSLAISGSMATQHHKDEAIFAAALAEDATSDEAVCHAVYYRACIQETLACGTPWHVDLLYEDVKARKVTISGPIMQLVMNLRLYQAADPARSHAAAGTSPCPSTPCRG